MVEWAFKETTLYSVMGELFELSQPTEDQDDMKDMKFTRT